MTDPITDEELERWYKEAGWPLLTWSSYAKKRVRHLIAEVRRLRALGPAIEHGWEYEVRRITAQRENLAEQIDELAMVILREFGGPVVSESACEMAVRVLREQKAELERVRASANLQLEEWGRKRHEF
jgi:hypothetical protein